MKNLNSNFIFILSFVFFLLSISTFAQEEEKKKKKDKELTEEQLRLLSKAMDNPLSQVWSLAFQYNQAWVNNNVNDETYSGSVLSFQPILPIPLNDDLMFFARPVVNMITLPDIKIDPLSPLSSSIDGHRTEFGDIIFGMGIGPQKTSGFLYGGGLSFIFPTASKEMYGSGKYQMGPAAILFYLSEKFLAGTLFQHWWSFKGGDESRDETNHSSFLCYFIYNLGNNWQLRYNPNISVDWNNKGNEVSFPLGLGVGKTTKLGKLPIKLMLEGQYAVVRPNLLDPFNNAIPGVVGLDAGMDWMLRFQVNFVIPSPFGDIMDILKM